MEEIVEKIIEKVESFGKHGEEWQELKEDTLKELERNSNSDNQALWLCITSMTKYMESYVG